MGQPQNIEDIQRVYDRQVRGVLEDQTLAEHYKMQEAERIYNQTRDQILQQVQREKEELELTLRARRREAFAPPKVSKDPGIDLLLFRQALTEVKEVTTPGELGEVLQRAELHGDEPLAKAVLLKAYDLRSSKLVEQYLRYRPEEDKKWEAFVGASEAFNEWERGQLIWGSGGRLRKPSEYQA